jgi:hypothetical protein
VRERAHLNAFTDSIIGYLVDRVKAICEQMCCKKFVVSKIKSGAIDFDMPQWLVFILEIITSIELCH